MICNATSICLPADNAFCPAARGVLRSGRVPLKRLWPVALLAAFFVAAAGPAQDVDLAPDDQKQTDPFEAHSLAKADKSFREKQYRAAAAEYDSFILEFPQSRVLSYALFRKARAIDLDNKRFEAIGKYKEVLDYFPNAVAYAAPALYFMGLCYAQTGDPENAVKSWTELVQDPDYRRNFLAAAALNMLAENYLKQKDPETAMLCYEQVVTDFRAANPDAAANAMWRVIEYRMKTKPNEPQLRAFYTRVQGFDREAQKLDGEPGASPLYWNFVRANVRRYGPSFDAPQAEERNKFYKYWADAMEGKFIAMDDFQIDLADFRFAYENDPEKRAKRLDAHFVKYQKPEDYDRVIRWLTLYPGNKAKLNEYYGKLDLSRLKPASMEKLVFALLEQKENDMARNAFDKLSFTGMDDGGRAGFLARMWGNERTRAGFAVLPLERLLESFADKENGAMIMLRYYFLLGDAKRGMPLAEKLVSSPRFATDALFIQGEFLFTAREFEKAIPKFQQANNPATNMFRIAECFVRLGKVDNAVVTLTEVENFFQKDAPRAALTIANYYRDAGLSDKRVAALRAVMKKYPGSPESSAAHQDLEKLGIKIGGGVDADQ